MWCRGCDFGQLHESGSSQPIVRCLQCGLRSCFVHSVEWHARLTCEEYDEMLKDPDEFKSAIDKEEEVNNKARRLQLKEDERLAQELDAKDKLAEQHRQQQRHNEQLKRAKAEQVAESDRRRQEQETKAAEQKTQRERLEEEKRQAKARQDAEAKRKRQEQERLKAIKEIKRRQREDQLSMDKVQSTTKQCPGCRWPIEKNDGCEHMTCESFEIHYSSSTPSGVFLSTMNSVGLPVWLKWLTGIGIKCRHEFCWHCMGSWSLHGSSGRCRR